MQDIEKKELKKIEGDSFELGSSVEGVTISKISSDSEEKSEDPKEEDTTVSESSEEIVVDSKESNESTEKDNEENKDSDEDNSAECSDEVEASENLENTEKSISSGVELPAWKGIKTISDEKIRYNAAKQLSKEIWDSRTFLHVFLLLVLGCSLTVNVFTSGNVVRVFTVVSLGLCFILVFRSFWLERLKSLMETDNSILD